MPKNVTKLEKNSWTGETQAVTKQKATTAEAVVGVVGLLSILTKVINGLRLTS